MGLNIFRFLAPKNGKAKTERIECAELYEAAREYQIRELCFWVCVDMIANAIGRCEVRTYRNNTEVFDREYYMWNVEPNVNQNSTAFWHKTIAKLCQDNESLIVSTRKRDGYDAIVVADDWQLKNSYPAKQNEYNGVVVGDMIYDKTFREGEVLHLQLRHMNLKPVLDGMYQSYLRLVNAAMQTYEWERGHHWKVHVSQMAQGDPKFLENFQAMIRDQIRPFLDSRGAILPEFDGYKYEDVGGSRTGALSDTRDIRSMVEDIFDFTARSFQIPAILISGKIEGVDNATNRFLTNCVDPICDQLQEEITRKRYGFDGWKSGSYARVDSSSIQHFDMFANAANVEKLVGSAAFTVNDILRAAGQPAIDEPWANQHFLTKNIAEMGSVVRALETREGEQE